MLGFPCDQFGHQEPGDETEIKNFCQLKYDVTFPLFAKIDVNGSHAHPLYKFLKSARRGFLWTKAIKWNFTKFLVDRQGNVVRRYAPIMTIERLERDVKRLLEALLRTLSVNLTPQIREVLRRDRRRRAPHSSRLRLSSAPR